MDDAELYIHPDDRDPEYCALCGRQLEGDELNYRTCDECGGRDLEEEEEDAISS